jgi:hypothetical protein
LNNEAGPHAERVALAGKRRPTSRSNPKASEAAAMEAMAENARRGTSGLASKMAAPNSKQRMGKRGDTASWIILYPILTQRLQKNLTGFENL